MNKLLSVAVAGVLASGASISAQAAIPEAEWEQFKAQFAAMAARVEALEAENAALKSGATVPEEDLSVLQSDIASLKAQNESSAWAEKLFWKGDFRYRYEDIDDGGNDRQRSRIRARAELGANVSDAITVGLGIATGGDDPVSTNQTLGGGGSTKDVRLDKAYFRYQPNEFWLSGGKVSNPFYNPAKSGLIWDGDYRPEGLFAGYEGKHFFANASYSHLESDTRNGLDESFWGAQIGSEFGPVTVAAGYLDFPIKGLPAFYDDALFGNSADEMGNYLYNYELVFVGADASFNIGDMPLSVYGDVVQNRDADDFDTGYIVGAKLGKAKAQGTWQLQYQYQDLEADATVGLLTDSDFMGGGTDGKGHKFSGAYTIVDKWVLGFTYFDGEKCTDSLKCDVRDYDRLMIDAKFKY
ncbi:hypothetical protein BST95_11860 [Halioglobus japonicus]|uniref:Porin n=1 Tax=Halioglobus japonicus TaxID=930805 RepID=A0AAP8SNU6_9GAMM|nr:putative porin [Halioglobus japonicus]AQA18830.1 hypothetical protein BST95_11860 [Halioglobus japonicus]PLW86864.1 hypothetical protein C0029_10860 [Halioglobus japonicus]GHD23647.1 hypothetical protein GCM10007052_36580 [Halioglobus japonicus]